MGYEALFLDLRQAGTFLGVVVVCLFVWVIARTFNEMRFPGADTERLRRRLGFSWGVLTGWGSLLGLNAWYTVYFMLKKPPWMLGGHWFVLVMVGSGLMSSLFFIRVATHDRWGEGPWVVTAMMAGLIAWLL